MCQVDDGDLYMRKDAPRVRKTESRGECVKCSSTDVVIPHGGHAALCRVCFLGNVNHKFRATVAKSQALRQGETVLMAYSGGVSSGAMLSLVAEGVREGTAKKLRFRPGAIVYVDESAAMSGSSSGLDADATEENSRREILESLSRHCRTIFAQESVDGGGGEVEKPPPYSPSLFVAPLENAMAIGEHGRSYDMNTSSPSSIVESPNEHSSKLFVDVMGESLGIDAYLDLKRDEQTIQSRRRLSTFLTSLRSATSRIRTVQLLRRKLISRIAKLHGYVHVMEGVSSSRVAIEIMTDLALGRGTQIPKDVGLVDDRFLSSDGVTVVRPLREFSNKEIVVYNNLAKVPTLVMTNMETGASPLTSIQRATEHFILGLQADFSSTVSTVCKTGEKLAGNQLKGRSSASEEGAERCCLCSTTLDVAESPLDDAELLRQITSPSLDGSNSGNGNLLATAARALDVTTVISRASSHAEVPPSEINGDLTQRKFESAISRALCYSCRLICRETNERGSKGIKTTESHEVPSASSCLDNLPSFVIEGAQQKDNQHILRNKIKDFLLDDT